MMFNAADSGATTSLDVDDFDDSDLDEEELERKEMEEKMEKQELDEVLDRKEENKKLEKMISNEVADKSSIPVTARIAVWWEKSNSPKVKEMVKSLRIIRRDFEQMSGFEFKSFVQFSFNMNVNLMFEYIETRRQVFSSGVSYEYNYDLDSHIVKPNQEGELLVNNKTLFRVWHYPSESEFDREYFKELFGASMELETMAEFLGMLCLRDASSYVDGILSTSTSWVNYHKALDKNLAPFLKVMAY